MVKQAYGNEIGIFVSVLTTPRHAGILFIPVLYADGQSNVFTIHYISWNGSGVVIPVTDSPCIIRSLSRSERSRITLGIYQTSTSGFAINLPDIDGKGHSNVRIALRNDEQRSRSTRFFFPPAKDYRPDEG